MSTRGAENINTQGGKHGFALHAAATPRYSKELVKYLLDEGADVNATGGRDGSALQAAARKGNKECVEILLANGANANTQGGKYGSALKAASSKQYHEIVRILIDHGAYDMPETETEGSSLDTLSVQDVGTEANPIQQAVDTECEQAEQQNLSPTPRRVKRDWRP
ncbi:ankyrin [Morchella conica CCBAS932]|uniref:Ankyrin n=1 Tax=Morchella conica CCBAS932 TaxID=1392247 RepID=A0A3N4KAD0_9PEZI|nr:ankyrin [Morchella conica CCBAS932]